MTIKENIINTIKQSNKCSFELDEIIALIEKVTERNELPTIESEGVILNPTKYEIVVDSNHIKMPKKEFHLLYYLMSNRNKVLHRNEILRDIWGTEVVVVDRTIDVHIRKLRQIVGHEKLQTIKGIGYGWFEK